MNLLIDWMLEHVQHDNEPNERHSGKCQNPVNQSPPCGRSLH
jgi:hypothetical protein